MTEGVFGSDAPDDGFDPLSVEHVAPFVSYLASPAADRISGQVFVVYGGMVALLAPATVETKFEAADGVFTAAEFADRITPYFEGRSPYQSFSAYSIAQLDTTGIQNLTQ